MKGGIGDDLVVAGKADDSYLVQRLLGQGGEDRMPLKKDALPDAEIDLIKRWINQGAPLPAEPPPRFVPAPGGLKRLTTAHYHNTLRDLFGDKADLPSHLEPDTLVAGSATVGAARIGLSEHGVEKFARAAFDLSTAALREPGFVARFVPCPVGDAPFDAACAQGFIRGFGRRAWRRPLTPEEIDRYGRLASGVAGQGGGGLAGGLAAVTAAMLQSPHFLYRSEIGVPDPKDPTRRRLTDYEMASRLAYFLWGAPPDDQLLDAAEAGRLSTEEGLSSETERMLRSPRARDTMSGFFVELFRLRRLDRLYEGRGKHPRFTTTVPQAMKGETLRLIEEVAFDPKRDFREIFSSRFTYVNGELARLYGLPAPADEKQYHRGSPCRRTTRAPASWARRASSPSSPTPTRRRPPAGESSSASPCCARRCRRRRPASTPSCPRTRAAWSAPSGRSWRRTARTRAATAATRPWTRWAWPSRASTTSASSARKRPGCRSTPAASWTERPSRPRPSWGPCWPRTPRLAPAWPGRCSATPWAASRAREKSRCSRRWPSGLQRDGYKFPALVANVIKSEGFRYLSAPSEETTARHSSLAPTRKTPRPTAQNQP